MIIIEKKPKYIHLYSDQDLVITNWDRSNILTYWGSKHAYCHTDAEAAAYYEITEEKHFEYEQEREKAETPEIPENITD